MTQNKFSEADTEAFYDSEEWILQSSFHQKDCSGYFDTSPQR